MPASDSDTETIEKLFVFSIEIELRAAAIYLAFAEYFPSVPGLANFWLDMQEDELGHARTLEDIRSALPPDVLQEAAPAEMWQNMQSLQKLISKDLMGGVHSLDDAYELAHELEFSEVNVLFNFLTSDVMTFGQQADITYTNIVKHQQKLLDFNNLFGNRDWRKGVPIEVSN